MRHAAPLALTLTLSLLACDAPAPQSSPDARADDPADAAAALVPEAPRAPQRVTLPGCAHAVQLPAGSGAPTVGDRVTFGREPAPRNVHVTWAADPATTVAVLWKTDADTRATAVEYGTAPDALTQQAAGFVTTARGLVGSITQHEAHLCGLRPDTTYHYRVGGPGHWSAVQRFKTAPAPGAPDAEAVFAVTGDSRDDMRVWRMVQERILSVGGARQPDFQVFTGDAVALGPIAEMWDEWFTHGAAAMARMPFLLAHGNHEALSVEYLLQFAQPQAGTPAQDELYFSLDYGPVHFVVLNDTPWRADYDNDLRRAQTAWLRADLAAHRARRAAVPWVVAVHHKAPFTSSNHRDDSDVVIVRETLPPLYDELGVDLVLNGHDHVFEVSHPLDGAGRRAPAGRRGVTYVIAGGAGAELYGTTATPTTRYAERTHNFAVVRATARALELTPYRADGTVITQGRVTLARP